MPILGPNCYGTINYLDGALLWFDQHGGRRCERGVAILTQSGNIGLNLTMQRRGLPIGHLMTLGNQACVGLSDCLAALVDDPRVTAIGLHIEAIDDARKFDAAARKALAARKPVVAVKAGRSEHGAALTLSHTASLAGADAAMDALLRRVGVARVASLPVLLETLKLLHTVGPLPGRDLVTLSCSGGEAALIADAGAQRRVRFRPFTRGAGRGGARHAQRPRHHLQPARLPHLHLGPARAPARDLHRGHGLRLGPRLPRPRLPARRQLQRRRLAGLARRLGSMRATRRGGRAAVLATLPDCLPESVAEALIAAGIVPLLGIDEALAAAEAAADIGAAQAAPLPAPLLPARPLDGAAVTLDEWQGKRLLAEHGVPHPGGRLVAIRGRPWPWRRSWAIRWWSRPSVRRSPTRASWVPSRWACATPRPSGCRHAHGRISARRSWSSRWSTDGVAELIVGVVPRPAGGLVPRARLGRRAGRASGRPGAAAAADDRR